MSKGFEWLDEHEKKVQEERSKDYFNIVEGANRFVLLSHCAPYAQVFDNVSKKYRPAVEGDKNVSIKGVCWVYQDNVIKSAMLPYTVVKQIRALTDDPDWDFELPFTHPLTITAVGAGTKEVTYSLISSPKTISIPDEILEELAKKPTPEEIVEKLKSKVSPSKNDEQKAPDYPEEDGINPEDTPW